MDVSTATDGAPHAEPPLPEYQSLSGAAVLALVLGLASPLALAIPVLLVVPAAAVGMAIVAQRRIRDSDGTQTGAAVARWGLALALVSATAALAHGPVRDAIYRRQMAEVARQWFTLLAEDRIDDSMSLLSAQAAASFRPTPSGPGETPPPEAVLRTIAREKLRSDAVARCLSGKTTPLVVTMQPAAAAPTVEGGRATLAADFTVAGSADEQPCRVTLVGVRIAGYAATGQPWRIERWGETAAPAANP